MILNELFFKITLVAWSQKFKYLDNHFLSLEGTQYRKSDIQGTQEMPGKQYTTYSHLVDPVLKVSLSKVAAHILYREEGCCKLRQP